MLSVLELEAKGYKAFWAEQSGFKGGGIEFIYIKQGENLCYLQVENNSNYLGYSLIEIDIKLSTNFLRENGG